MILPEDNSNVQHTTPPEKSELLPCPFCLTDKPNLVISGNDNFIYCRNEDCWCRTSSYPNKHSAIARWNTRATPQPVKGEMKQLQDELQLANAKIAVMSEKVNTIRLNLLHFQGIKPEIYDMFRDALTDSPPRLRS